MCNYYNMNHKNMLIKLLILCLSCGFLSGCKTTKGLSISKTGFYMNTIVTITLYDTADEELLDKGMKLCERYDDLLSKTKEGSDIYKINHSNGTPVTVSEETANLLLQAIQFGEQTDGLFDITIGTVSRLWDFTGEHASVPNQDTLSQAAKLVDYRTISVSGNAVTVPHGVELDLGGIAKGYIGDQLKEYYVNQGIKSALLNLGGNIICIGTPPNKEQFHIGIKKPFSDNDSITDVYVDDQCVVTSGIYERYFEQDGKLYHHILNPRDGYPVENDLYSVTIITDNSMYADVYSTTCLLLGLENGKKFIKHLEHIQAIFVTNDYEVIQVP